MQAQIATRIAILLLAIVCLAVQVPTEELMSSVPGYPSTYANRVFAGYIPTSSPLRKLHYIFMESQAGENNKDPVTLWMNGGPGCTSKLGFLQEIPPYYLNLNTPYKDGDSLT